ncbi:MAG: hypothetical protein J6X26_02085 [Bacteroidales bacterium]|nr:hypothetical protein [Bacteroidales bacterium]
MKKALLIIVIILLAILVVPILNYIGWSSQTKKPIDVIVVDKTVTSFKMDKHKSFNWVLKNNGFVDKSTGKSISYKDSYYGFLPTRPAKSRLWDKKEYRLAELIDLAEKADALYFTDTYGVFFNDWYQGATQTRRSRKLYGGLNNNDNLLIKEMKDRGKLVLLESNCFDYPTAEYESQKAQERLGIEFSGWTGKYYASLDSNSADFPIWMTSMYRKQYNQPWNFTKAGVVFVSDEGIVVLEDGKHLTSALPMVVTDQKYMAKWNLPEKVAFDQSFEVIEPINNNIISCIELATTAEGAALLEENGISSILPVAIQDPSDEKTYYFAGDFTYFDTPMCTASFKGFISKFLFSTKPSDPNGFFYTYYKPLIEGIFNDYYSSK